MDTECPPELAINSGGQNIMRSRSRIEKVSLFQVGTDGITGLSSILAASQNCGNVS